MRYSVLCQINVIISDARSARNHVGQDRKKYTYLWNGNGEKKCHTGNEMKVNRLVLETQSRAATKLNLVHLLKIRQDLMKMVKCEENSVGFSTIAIAMIFKALRIDDENAWIVQRVIVVDFGPKFRMEKIFQLKNSLNQTLVARTDFSKDKKNCNRKNCNQMRKKTNRFHGKKSLLNSSVLQLQRKLAFDWIDAVIS